MMRLVLIPYLPLSLAVLVVGSLVYVPLAMWRRPMRRWLPAYGHGVRQVFDIVATFAVILWRHR